MKKLTYGDLTPDFLKELTNLGTEKEIIDICAAKGYEIAEKDAAKLLEQFRKAAKLSEESLKEIAGGGEGYTGTNKLFTANRRGAFICPEYDPDEPCSQYEQTTPDCWGDCLYYCLCDS